MKITKSQLQSIIKEELERIMEDGHDDRPSAIRKLKVSMEKAHEILAGLQHHQGELPAWWMSKVTKAADYLNSARDYFLVSGELMEEELDEVYSEKQRRWACAQTSDDFKGERTLSRKEAEEMCKGPMLKKSKK